MHLVESAMRKTRSGVDDQSNVELCRNTNLMYCSRCTLYGQKDSASDDLMPLEAVTNLLTKPGNSIGTPSKQHAGPLDAGWMGHNV